MLTSLYSLNRIGSRNEFERFIKSQTNLARKQIEDQFMYHQRLPFTGSGWCGVCQQWTTLEYSAHHSSVSADGALSLACTETSVCRNCRCNSRMRASADFIMNIANRIESPLVYLTEMRTFFFRGMSKLLPAVYGSEYMPDVPFGTLATDGVLSDNIERSSFRDNTFDIVGSFDVFEHIPNPEIGLAEVHRILKSGGTALLTFPFYWTHDQTERRAYVTPDGEIKHLKPPVYHGNPIDSQGSLVFNDIGWDFIERARQLFSTVEVVHYSSFLGWHFGDFRFILLLSK